MNIELPPLPERLRQMLCTKCGYQNPETEAPAPHAPCENSNCQYIAFVTEREYTADQMQSYERAAIEAHEARKGVPTGWAAPKDRYTTPVLFNPYTGEPRDARDVMSDPQGILMVPIGAQVLASAPQSPKASVVQEPVQEPLTDEQIKRFGETIGVKVKGWKDYESWGLGYRVDEDGSYTIPNVPDILVPFARAIEAAHGITKEPSANQPRPPASPDADRKSPR